MHVKARARTHVAEQSALDGFCACEIVRCGELDIAWLTLKYADLHACPLYERRVIGEIVAALRDGAPVSFEQGRKGERLRRLHQSDGIAIERRFNHSRSLDALD